MSKDYYTWQCTNCGMTFDDNDDAKGDSKTYKLCAKCKSTHICYLVDSEEWKEWVKTSAKGRVK